MSGSTKSLLHPLNRQLPPHYRDGVAEECNRMQTEIISELKSCCEAPSPNFGWIPRICQKIVRFTQLKYTFPDKAWAEVVHSLFHLLFAPGVPRNQQTNILSCLSPLVRLKRDRALVSRSLRPLHLY